MWRTPSLSGARLGTEFFLGVGSLPCSPTRCEHQRQTGRQHLTLPWHGRQSTSHQPCTMVSSVKTTRSLSISTQTLRCLMSMPSLFQWSHNCTMVSSCAARQTECDLCVHSLSISSRRVFEEALSISRTTEATVQLVIPLTDALVGCRPVKHASVSLCKTSIGGSQHGTDTEKKSEKKHRN